MKKMILSAFVLAAFATVGNAQTVATQVAPAAQENVAVAAVTTTATPAADPQKVQVAKAELPQAIQQLLATDTYKDMEFQDAWLVKGDSEVYLVNLKKGEAVTQLKLNKEGKTVS